MGDHNLAGLSERALERHGDRDAIFFEGEWHRSADLFERSRKVAGGFVSIGVQPGDRVVVMMPNCPEVGLAYNGAWRAGAAITPVVFLLPPPDLRHILEDSEAAAVVTSAEFLPVVQAAAEGIDSIRKIVCLDGPDEGSVVPFARLEESDPIEIVDRDDADLAALMYTGGTTGRAKGVMLSHENLWFCGKNAHDASHVPGLTRTIIPLPLSHAFGLIVTVVGAHAVEPGVAVLQRWFDPVPLLELIAEHRIDQAAMVPSMIQILLGLPLEEHDLSSLRYITSGASPLPAEVVEEFERRVPGVEIREGYGCTESGAVISTTPAGARKRGSVGPPIPGYEVRIVDDSGRPVAPGELGEICCRSAGVMSGYWKAPEATETTLVDGWLHTGDIGRMDEDGYLYVVDRKKDLIIRGGFNVFPRDVEDVLVEHPAVAMAGVVGKPDELKGEEVVAFISLSPGAETTPEEVIDFAKSQLGAYKYPRDVRIVPNIPLTPVGKIDRKELRKQL